MKRIKAVYFCTLLLASITSQAAPLWQVSYGILNSFDHGNHDAFIEVSYKQSPVTRFELSPIYGLSASDSGTFFAFAGFSKNLVDKKKWGLDLHSAAGYFDHSKQIYLGHHFEIKTGFDVYWKTAKKHQVGLTFQHYSNARLSHINPGTESISIFYRWH